ncbi:MAG: HD domain-containing phosphohydrolase, partial [Halanaerobium sp.]|nr:HD domain-containing phosphohydrolase [Halanaerobium sp.]
EFNLVKQHPNYTYSILQEIPGHERYSLIGLQHHENYDGNGYPRGIAEKSLETHSQIVAIADVFDALTSARPYHAAYSKEVTVAIMRNDRGTKFNPDLLDQFLQVV